jgi:hypothetical protein
MVAPYYTAGRHILLYAGRTSPLFFGKSAAIRLRLNPLPRGQKTPNPDRLPAARCRRSITAMPLNALAEVDVASILMGLVAFLVIAVLGYLAVRALNKWMRNDDEALGAGFTLSQLRQLHKSGQMSSEEFEKAKAILLAATHKPDPKGNSTDRPPL